MLQVLVILFLLLANGILAMAEIAIVSARRTRLKQLADAGDLGARSALRLSENPSHFLSTVQIGITLVGILAGAFGGAALADPLAGILRQVPLLAPYASEIAFGIVVLLITYFSLVIGELVPKRLALVNPERVAGLLAPPMRVLSRLTGPLVTLMTVSTDAVVRLLGVRATNDQTVTEEEVKIMIDEGTATGVFEPSEREIVGRVFRLGDLDVGALMTPRSEIVALDIKDPEETIREKLTRYSYSRFPVISGSVDNVVGVVKTKDILARYLAGKPLALEAILGAPLFVPEGMKALELLEKFKEDQTHIAMVIDEYGGVQGVVTINGVLESVVGNLSLGEGKDVPTVLERADGSFLVDGRLASHEFKEKLGFKTLPDEDAYQTVGGFVMAMLGRIPTEGDAFEWDGWRVEVMDMDGRRVDKVLVQQGETGTTEAPAAAGI